MLNFLPRPMVALLALLLHSLNIIYMGCLITLVAPLRFLLPLKSWRLGVERFYRLMPALWSHANHFILWLTSKTKFEIHLDKSINCLRSYVLMCNHISWSDIPVLQKAIAFRAPPVVYFMKQQLMWVPFLGWACWLLGFPFMRRYTRAELLKNPHKRGIDIDAARRACKKFNTHPATIVNFSEGTRLTAAKHERQQSPYKHLLKPKGGGVALAINVMGEQVKEILNVTLIYPDTKNFWDFLGGRAKKIIAYIEHLPITADLRGDYQSDDHFRQHFQAWMNQVWLAKDRLIDQCEG